MEVFITSDYDKFKKIPGNRPVVESHVESLVKAMEEDDLHEYDPITVNDKWGVIDGQHRLEARRRLGRPVHYEVVSSKGKDDIEVVQKLNSRRKNWTNENRLDSFIERGFNDYRLIKDFMRAYKFSLNISLLILGESQVGGKEETKFKDGNFKIKSTEAAAQAAKRVNEFQQYYPGYKRRCFVCACMKMFAITEYNHKRMIEKMSYQTERIFNCPDTISYLKMLEGIYNYKQIPSTKVRFF